MKQKWIQEEQDTFYPIPDTTLHLSPGPGVFQFFKNPNPQDGRLGLKKIGEKFEFDFKIYDLGCDDFLKRVKETWNSDYFIKKGGNLGVILNGIRGTGKTISAKILCNTMDLPVIIIPYCVDGIQDFIQNLEFECVILIDEAEKTFKSDRNSDRPTDEILLKVIDGVYNKSRKMYILTTNKLTLNENLLGRPGRIRYIKQFGNLTPGAINEFLKDNLQDMSKKDLILQAVDLLEISTIDILRSMVDEVNIHGDLGGEQQILNVPKANYVYKVFLFSDTDTEDEKKIKEMFAPHIKAGDVDKWLQTKDEGGDTVSNMIYDVYDGYTTNMTCKYSSLYKGSETNLGEIMEEVDKDGWTSVSPYGGSRRLVLILGQKSGPSLYAGKLV